MPGCPGLGVGEGARLPYWGLGGGMCVEPRFLKRSLPGVVRGPLAAVLGLDPDDANGLSPPPLRSPTRPRGAPAFKPGLALPSWPASCLSAEPLRRASATPPSLGHCGPGALRTSKQSPASIGSRRRGALAWGGDVPSLLRSPLGVGCGAGQKRGGRARGAFCLPQPFSAGLLRCVNPRSATHLTTPQGDGMGVGSGLHDP